MTEPRYFRPRNWSKFQSRSNNSMAWVKTYTELLDKPEYRNLTENQRAVLHGIWLLCGRTGRPLERDCRFIGGALGLRSQTIGKALPVLELNDFIELCDRTSKLHDELPSPRREEKRVDKKERTPPPSSEGSPPQKSNGQIRKGSRLPEDWQPTPEEIAYATERGFDETAIRDIVEDFRTYWTLGKGRNVTHADWKRAWQTWIRRESPRQNRPKRHDPGSDRLGHGSVIAAARRNLV